MIEWKRTKKGLVYGYAGRFYFQIWQYNDKTFPDGKTPYPWRLTVEIDDHGVHWAEARMTRPDLSVEMTFKEKVSAKDAAEKLLPTLQRLYGGK